jgi:hypothetical protein
MEETLKKNINSKNFCHPFFLKTNMRIFELYSSSE